MIRYMRPRRALKSDCQREVERDRFRGLGEALGRRCDLVYSATQREIPCDRPTHRAVNQPIEDVIHVGPRTARDA